jgi:hypothetical protein
MHITSGPWNVQDTAWAQAIADLIGERLSRLFISACARSFWKKSLPPEAAEAFEVLDRFADTGKSKVLVREAKERVGTLEEWEGKFSYQISNMTLQTVDVPRAFLKSFGKAPMILRQALTGDFDLRLFPKLGVGAEYNLKLSPADARAYLERVLSDFIPPKLSKNDVARWRTSDTLSLARGIYYDRAFDRMPILADALMDAGCEDERVIGHCRGESNHYRGCWVLDLILDGQWEGVWSESKPAAKPKAPKPPPAPAGSAFQLTPAVAKEIDLLMQEEANWPAAEAVARAFVASKGSRKQTVQTYKGMFGWTAKEAESYVASLCLEAVRDGLRCGIARRVRLDDPRELAQYVSLEARAELINIWGDGNREILERLRPVTLAAAVGDGVVLRRFVETSPFPLTSGQPDEVRCYNAIYALAAGDVPALRRLFPYKPKRKAAAYPVPHLQCLSAVAEGDPDRFRDGLVSMLDSTKRSFKGAVTGLLDVFSHGIYELCRRAGAEAVAAFDIGHAPPWDAGLYRWVRERKDALADFDWSAIPEEVRDGLRDLSEPVWKLAAT